MKENYWLRQPEELSSSLVNNRQHQANHKFQQQQQQQQPPQKELRDDDNHGRNWPHEISARSPQSTVVNSDNNNTATNKRCNDNQTTRVQPKYQQQQPQNQIIREREQDNLNNNSNSNSNNNNDYDYDCETNNEALSAECNSRLLDTDESKDCCIQCLLVDGQIGQRTTKDATKVAEILPDQSHKAVAKKVKTLNDTNEINLSFCGCGFLGIYHVGVASCFHQYAPQLSMHKIAGSSAGALVAVAHICGNLQLAYATTDILRVAIDARARALGPFHPSFDINATVRKALERGLPEDVHERASGKLHISLTRVYDGANVIINEFESKDEVIQALLCSCFIPFWSGLQAPKFRGTTYIDGGFSNNQLILDNKTVAVSPFAGEADICPQDDSLNLLQISLSNTSFSISPNNLYRLSHALLPPPPEILSDLCEQGFADGIRFLQRMKLISCTKCLEIRSSLLVTTNGEDMKEAFSKQVSSVDLQTSDSIGIRLEQQEQKMIEINDDGTTTTVKTQHSSSNSSSSSRRFLTRTDDDDDYDDDHCSECVIIRQKALYDPLPAQFSDRIRDACDAVNKSLSNWIYSYRPVKYLSYLAFTPVDISLALVLRCWQELPLIRSELLNFICNIAKFLLNLIRQILTRSTSALLMDESMIAAVEKAPLALCSNSNNSTGTLDGDAKEYEKEIARFKRRVSEGDSKNNEEVIGNDAICTTTVKTKHSCKHHHHHHKSDHDRMMHTELPDFLFPPQQQQQTGINNSQSSTNLLSISASNHGGSTGQLHSLEDTFDSIVDVTSNQEARIFAYYFRDAKNRLQVTEIFDHEKAAELSHSTTSLNSLHTTN